MIRLAMKERKAGDSDERSNACDMSASFLGKRADMRQIKNFSIAKLTKLQ